MSQYAKAIAAGITPVVLALITEGLEAIGVDTKLDPTVVGTAVTSVVTAFLVWLVKNRRPI